jgi:hypothetical protein
LLCQPKMTSSNESTTKPERSKKTIIFSSTSESSSDSEDDTESSESDTAIAISYKSGSGKGGKGGDTKTDNNILKTDNSKPKDKSKPSSPVSTFAFTLPPPNPNASSFQSASPFTPSSVVTETKPSFFLPTPPVVVQPLSTPPPLIQSLPLSTLPPSIPAKSSSSLSIMVPPSIPAKSSSPLSIMVPPPIPIPTSISSMPFQTPTYTPDMVVSSLLKIGSNGFSATKTVTSPIISTTQSTKTATLNLDTKHQPFGSTNVAVQPTKAPSPPKLQTKPPLPPPIASVADIPGIGVFASPPPTPKSSLPELSVAHLGKYYNWVREMIETPARINDGDTSAPSIFSSDNLSLAKLSIKPPRSMGRWKSNMAYRYSLNERPTQREQWMENNLARSISCGSQTSYPIQTFA